MAINRKAWLLVAPVVLCLADQSITLWGQSGEYWAGDYQRAREGCPPYRWLLAQHPLAFGAGIAAWIAVFSTAILLLPRRVAMIASVAIILGHTWGTATWLFASLRQGYWLCLALFLVSSVLTVLTWETQQPRHRRDGEV